jgi:hypothetical protein
MKNLFKNFYSKNFVYKGKEKLSKLTILFIFLLNVFIFITIGLGIDFQIKVLNNPNVAFPYQCRTIINTNKIDDFNKYFYSSKDYSSKYQSIKNEEMDVRCNTLLNEKLKVVKKEHDIKELKNTQSKIDTKLNKVSTELLYLRENYNTVLFEKMSSQNSSKSIIKDEVSSENIKLKYNEYLKENEKLKKEKENLLKQFKNSTSVKNLVFFVQENKKQIKEDYKNLTKSYAIKKELIALLFLSPLLFLSFYIMKRFLANEKYTLYIMFKNIMVVIFIPTIISLISLIYILIPKIFLEKVLRFFYELEIPFIVYYLVVAALVLVFGYIIVKIQKRHRESIKKLEDNSISKIESYNKSVCNKCFNKVDYLRMNFCPNCKNELKVKCKSCEKETINGLDYCTNCGESLY